MSLPRPCDNCKKRFKPFSYKNRWCDKCRKYILLNKYKCSLCNKRFRTMKERDIHVLKCGVSK